MSSPRKYVFTGGGTGGHVAPALAIAESIRQEHPNAFFYYVGVAGKAEASMVPRAWEQQMAASQASLHFVRSRGFPGVGPKMIPFLLDLALGVLKSFILLLRWRPDVIVATGGYVAAPILLATFFLRRLGLIKPVIFLHEQNAVLGRMNKLAVRFADKVGLAFGETKVPKSKKAFVGYPVRKAVAAKRKGDAGALKVQAREKLKIPSDAKVIFAFGGSQGARTINRGIVAALPRLLADPKVWVIHGTGKQLRGNAYNGMQDVKTRLQKLQNLPSDWEQRYLPNDFFHDMGSYYSATDVVVCRGGAGSLNEVCANGVPAIVIPKANLPGDHQAFNARSMERMNAVRVIYESVDLSQSVAIEQVDPEVFADLLFELLDSPEKCMEMVKAGSTHYNPNTTKYCSQLIDAMLGFAEGPQLPEPPVLAKERILGLNSNQLISLLRKEQHSLSVEERRLALYKVDGYLASGGYVLPARGCRMVGYGKFASRKHILLSFAADKDARGYIKLPITRRDAYHGLLLLGDASEDVLQVLELGICDPYFEARMMALKTVESLSRQNSDVEAFHRYLPKLKELTTHKAFDTRIGSIKSLGEIVTDFAQVEKIIVERRFDSHWKVRVAVLQCLTRLVERGIISAEKAAIEGNEVLRTSDGYRMIFPIKEAFNDLPGRSVLKE